jgi:hypothetical protein
MNSLKSHSFVIGSILVSVCSHVWAANLPFGGQPQAGTISAAAQSNTYTFSANANDVVDFTMVTTSGNLLPRIRLYNSAGTLLSQAYNHDYVGNCVGGSTLELNTVTLTAAGTYTVLIGDCGDTNTGNYLIYAQRTNNPAGAVALLFGGQPQNGTISSAAQSNSYTLTANANDVVDFTMVTTTGNLLPKIRLYNSSGTLVSQAYNHDYVGNCVGGSTLELNTVTLTAAGAYTVLIGDCGDTNTGNYLIYAQRTNNPAGAAALLFGGQLQNGTISSAAQSNSYTFSANANAVVDFTMVTTNGNLLPKIRLYNSSGTLVNQAYNHDYVGNCVGGSTLELNTGMLKAAGTYTVLIGDCGDTNTGAYTLSSQCFGVCTATPPLGPPTVVIDSPAAGAVLASGNVVISGWAIDNASALGTAISTVLVKVDGNVVGTAFYGISRPDVCTALPGRPNCPNVGYSFSLNTNTLAAGTHTLTVSATDTDPTPDTGTATLMFTTGVMGPPTVVIDSPAPSSVVSGTITVSGWAIDNISAIGTPIASVQVMVDGSVVGNASYGVARPDVCTFVGLRPGCPNVGFTFPLNTSGLSDGTHTITVSATDTDGNPDIGTESVPITVMRTQPPLVYIDNPTSGATVTGIVTVSGWAIDNPLPSGGTPIASVQVKVDGNVVGTANYGTPRPDVCAAYPSRPSCPNVGWTFSLDVTGLASGPHMLTAVATDTDSNPDSGSWSEMITVGSQQPLVFIDTPASGSVVSGTVTLSGWAIDFAGGNAISSVAVKVDGNFVGNAMYGTLRPDVCTFVGLRPGCPNVGFTFSLNTGNLSLGTHTVTVSAADSFPTPFIGSKSVTIAVTSVPIPPPLVHIDTPAPGATVSGTVAVTGWAFDTVTSAGTPIGSVQVMVDGGVVGNATYGTARPDVCVFVGLRPGCPNVGFTFSLNTSTLAAGSHTITVTATDTDLVPDSASASVTVTK